MWNPRNLLAPNERRKYLSTVTVLIIIRLASLIVMGCQGMMHGGISTMLCITISPPFHKAAPKIWPLPKSKVGTAQSSLVTPSFSVHYSFQCCLSLLLFGPLLCSFAFFSLYAGLSGYLTHVVRFTSQKCWLR
jgi:hypothetical protein